MPIAVGAGAYPVECGLVARHQREVQHRIVVHLQLVMLHQTKVVVIEAEAEEMHFLIGQAHRRARVGMIERGELQVEELHIEVFRPFKVADVNDVVLQLGCGDVRLFHMDVHGSASLATPPLRRLRTQLPARAPRWQKHQGFAARRAEQVFRR